MAQLGTAKGRADEGGDVRSRQSEGRIEKMKKTKKETKTGPRSGTIPPRASGFSFTRLGDHSIRAMLGLSAIILVCS